MATSAAYGYTGYGVPPPTCRFPGCSRPCYTESYGRVHDFCGRTHASEFSRLYGNYGVSSSSSTKKRQVPSYPASSSISSSSRQPMKAIHHFTPSLPLGRGPSTTGNRILFYNRDEPYYEFTNFYPCTVTIDGKYWPTTEHYFQAQKFVGTPYLEKIRRLHTPREAFQLSRDPAVSRWQRSDWEVVKDNIMLKALRVKFNDTGRLRDKLRGTGDKELVEHTSNDSYWGDGGDGRGQNRLGKLLMQVRRELREQYGPYRPSSSHSYYLRSQDDSHVSLQPVPSSSTSKPILRRTNSMSNISNSRTSQTLSSSFHSGWYQGGIKGGSGSSNLSGASNVISNIGKKGKQTFNVVKNGATKLADKLQPPNSNPHSHSNRNRTSSTGHSHRTGTTSRKRESMV